MIENDLFHFINGHKTFARKFCISVAPNDMTVVIGRDKIFRKTTAILGYLLIIFLFMVVASSVCLRYYSMAVIMFALALLCIYLTRFFTRIVVFDLRKKTVSVYGQLKRKQLYKWDNCQGTETFYTIKDFPDKIFVKFQDATETSLLKLVTITPPLRKFNPIDYDNLMIFWRCLEREMLH